MKNYLRARNAGKSLRKFIIFERGLINHILFMNKMLKKPLLEVVDEVLGGDPHIRVVAGGEGVLGGVDPAPCVLRLGVVEGELGQALGDLLLDADGDLSAQEACVRLGLGHDLVEEPLDAPPHLVKDPGYCLSLHLGFVIVDQCITRVRGVLDLHEEARGLVCQFFDLLQFRPKELPVIGCLGLPPDAPTDGSLLRHLDDQSLGELDGLIVPHPCQVHVTFLDLREVFVVPVLLDGFEGLSQLWAGEHLVPDLLEER